MSLITNDCIEFHDNRKICIASEKGKKYQLNNDSRYEVRKVKVEDCVIQGVNKKRCDYLMNIDSVKRVFFVELKGGALNEAVKQIVATIDFLKSEFVGYRLDARIVGSGDVPNLINTPEYVKLVKLVKSKDNIKRATNNLLEENI